MMRFFWSSFLIPLAFPVWMSGPPKEVPPIEIAIMPVKRISFYQAVKRQTDSDPTESACGPTLRPWQQVAVSRDLFRRLGCGTRIVLRLESPVAGRVYVNAIVWDKMHTRWKNSVDVLVAPNEPALEYGFTKGVLVFPARKGLYKWSGIQ